MIHPPTQEYLDTILHAETKRLFASNTFSVIKERFLETGAGVYPQQALEEMQRDKYDPIIFGYVPDFEVNPKNQIIKEAFMELGVEWIEKPYIAEHMHIALGDLSPKDHRDALTFRMGIMKKIEDSSTKTPHHPDLLKTMEKLGEYQKQNPSFELLCWVFAFYNHRRYNYSVSLLEHPDILRWKQEAEGDRGLREQLSHGDSVWEDAGVGILHYTDIQRDVHNIQFINALRPGVIAISTRHALAYDMLLNRDGSRSFYFPHLNPEQLVEFSLRNEVHGMYKERMKG